MGCSSSTRVAPRALRSYRIEFDLESPERRPPGPGVQSNKVPGDAAERPDGHGWNKACSWIMCEAPSPRRSELNLRGLHILATVGVGSFGRVRLARVRGSDQHVAIKSYKKADIQRKQMTEAVMAEVDVLLAAQGSPFVVNILHAFQTQHGVHLVLQYCPGGELFGLLTRYGCLPFEIVRFFAVELALALEHLHGLGWAYRDLKPDNCLLSPGGHVVLADFGLATRVEEDGSTYLDRRCGTIQYLAPEIACGHKQRKSIAVDWWALGCVLFELMSGKPPFGELKGPNRKTQNEVVASIAAGRLSFPRSTPKDCAAFIRGLLNPQQAHRFGFQDVRAHAWVADVDWAAARACSMKPPLVPPLRGPGDRSAFPYMWSEEPIEPQPKSATPESNPGRATTRGGAVGGHAEPIRLPWG